LALVLAAQAGQQRCTGRAADDAQQRHSAAAHALHRGWAGPGSDPRWAIRRAPVDKSTIRNGVGVPTTLPQRARDEARKIELLEEEGVERDDRAAWPRRSPRSARPPMEWQRYGSYATSLAVANNALNVAQPTVVPAFTKQGFQVVETPAPVQDALMATLVEHRANWHDEWEFPAHTFSLIDEFPNGTAKTKRIGTHHHLQLRVMHHLQKVVERWARMPVDLPKFYGIRVYIRDAALKFHCDCMNENLRDRPDARALSAIIQISQDVEEAWPLVIKDHAGVFHNVTLRPGQTVLYESARLVHGRPYPLRGREYVNAFVHFKPANWTIDNIREVVRGVGQIKATLLSRWHAFETEHQDDRLPAPG
jgi:hypothetical protein